MTKNSKAVALTTERRTTHGSFAEVSRITSALTNVIKTAVNYPSMPEAQKMALKEIFHKIARIGSGNANLPDHWEDIGGYGELGSQACVPFPESPTLTRQRRKVKAKVKKPVRKAKKAVKKKVKARPARKAAKKVNVHLRSRRSGVDLRTVVQPQQEAA